MLDTSIKTDIKGLQQLSKDFPEASRQARFGRITEALMFLQGVIKDLTPVGAGPYHLRDTIFPKVEMGEPVMGILGTPAPYGEAIELGTKPHFPPVAPILFWVENKLGLSGKEALSAAYAIVRKIGKTGTYGTHMFQYGFERSEAAIINILNKIPADIVARVSK